MNKKKIIKKVRSYEKTYRNMTQEDLADTMQKLREQVIAEPTERARKKKLDSLLPLVFGMACAANEAALGMKPFDVQIEGAISLHEGRIAEMKTGEGKTLVASLPAALNALTGKGVHVITVNDYLAKRDSAQMGEAYRRLGLTCGCIYAGMPFKERKAAYQCDITYGTNSEFGFDYLRDNLAKAEPMTVQRGLEYAIVDEVDSVLIDDSKTPLIISGQAKNCADTFMAVDKAVKGLKRTTNYDPDATLADKIAAETVEYDGDYILIEKTKEIILTDAGVAKVEAALGQEMSEDGSLISHYVHQSLRANYVMAKDVDYVVKDGKVLIVDGSTGRIMASRKYSDSLHQAIEAKEGVEITSENVTQGTITYQNFFRMYGKLSGMTGTAWTARDEMKEIYGLKVDRIPTNRPVIRTDAPDQLFPTKEKKYAALAEKAAQLHAKGQPLLIGTPSVEESEIAERVLRRAIKGVGMNMLNAKNHEKEAEIIAQAGAFGAITIATNMAGRGTDILLGGNPAPELKDLKARLDAEEITKEEHDRFAKEIKERHEKDRQRVVEAGGLAVLGVERFDNRRIDDQLRGRSGRQGDPGYSQFFLSMEDRLLRVYGMGGKNLDFSYTSGLNDKMIRNAQKQVEGISFAARKNTLDYDDVNDSQRKQVYGIRREIMLMDGEGTMELFRKYEDEVCRELMKGNEPTAALFRGAQGISRDGIRGYIDGKIEENSKVLEENGDRMENMVKFIMLSDMDRMWIDHINQSLSLKEATGITTMGSLRPIQLYKTQSVAMFNELIWSIKKQIVLDVANVRIVKREKPKPEVINLGTIRIGRPVAKKDAAPPVDSTPSTDPEAHADAVLSADVGPHADNTASADQCH